jgi:hypothetical protein
MLSPEKLMAQNEIFWDEASISQGERGTKRQQYTERYREHIRAGDPFHPYVPYPYIE